MLNDQEIASNLRAVRDALAQQALEGLTVPPATVHDLERVARGEITSSDALRNAHARFGNTSNQPNERPASVTVGDAADVKVPY